MLHEVQDRFAEKQTVVERKIKNHKPRVPSLQFLPKPNVLSLWGKKNVFLDVPKTAGNRFFSTSQLTFMAARCFGSTRILKKGAQPIQSVMTDLPDRSRPEKVRKQLQYQNP